MKKTIKKIINVIIDVVVLIIMVVSALVVILSLTSRSSGVPNIFGYAPLSVRTDSMEPTFYADDLIISEVTAYSGDEYDVGDVVTFPIKIDGEEVLNTHRIIEKSKDEGIIYYKTQGDNNPLPDDDLINGNIIVAKWTEKKIPTIGGVLAFIRTQLGFFLCVLLPMIIFFVYEAIRVIMNLMAYNKEKAIEEAKAVVENSELTEEQKQRAIAEYLAQQKTEEVKPTVQTPAVDETSEAEQN